MRTLMKIVLALLGAAVLAVVLVFLADSSRRAPVPPLPVTESSKPPQPDRIPVLMPKLEVPPEVELERARLACSEEVRLGADPVAGQETECERYSRLRREEESKAAPVIVDDRPD